MSAQALIPNTQIEQMFYLIVEDMDKVRSYREQAQKGTSQGVAAATALASGEVYRYVKKARDMELTYRAAIEQTGGSIFID